MRAAMQKRIIAMKAIQRAYFVASRRQCEITSRPHVIESETMPKIMKNRVMTHSGGRLGEMHILFRPWMVWHCLTRPTVRAPSWPPVLIQSGFAILAIAKISAARKRHPEIMVSLSIFILQIVNFMSWGLLNVWDCMRQLSLPLSSGNLMEMMSVHHSKIASECQLRDYDANSDIQHTAHHPIMKYYSSRDFTPELTINNI